MAIGMSCQREVSLQRSKRGGRVMTSKEKYVIIQGEGTDIYTFHQLYLKMKENRISFSPIIFSHRLI